LDDLAPAGHAASLPPPRRPEPRPAPFAASAISLDFTLAAPSPHRP
jgi:hypothetical protein